VFEGGATQDQYKRWILTSWIDSNVVTFKFHMTFIIFMILILSLIFRYGII
jgi:hypothetical protein